MGHGCSVEWSNKNTNMIKTTFTQSYKMQSIEFNSIKGCNFEMINLSDLKWNTKSSINLLMNIPSQYKDWIDTQKSNLNNLNLDKKLISQSL